MPKGKGERAIKGEALRALLLPALARYKASGLVAEGDKIFYELTGNETGGE